MLVSKRVPFPLYFSHYISQPPVDLHSHITARGLSEVQGFAKLLGSLFRLFLLRYTAGPWGDTFFPLFFFKVCFKDSEHNLNL